MKELQKIVRMKSNRDLQQLSKQLKTLTRKIDNQSKKISLSQNSSNKNQSIENSLIEYASSCGEATIDLIFSIHELVNMIHQDPYNPEFEKIHQQFTKNLEIMISNLKKSTELGKLWIEGDASKSQGTARLKLGIEKYLFVIISIYIKKFIEHFNLLILY